MNRIIDTAILAGLFAAGSYLIGYAYFGAFKVAVLSILH